MAAERTGQTLPGIVASRDMTADQFKFIRIDGKGKAILAGDGQSIVGVLQNKPSALEESAIIWGPGSVTKVVAGNNVTAGSRIASDASGLANAGSSGDYIVGNSLTAASTGELITLIISPQGREP